MKPQHIDIVDQLSTRAAALSKRLELVQIQLAKQGIYALPGLKFDAEEAKHELEEVRRQLKTVSDKLGLFLCQVCDNGVLKIVEANEVIKKGFLYRSTARHIVFACNVCPNPIVLEIPKGSPTRQGNHIRIITNSQTKKGLTNVADIMALEPLELLGMASSLFIGYDFVMSQAANNIETFVAQDSHDSDDDDDDDDD